ncbi:MAG: hypothetical protein K1X44_01480 [Alphaproteobacteria bacterium]|nr:hypothetical protein [Alphaproteobacteria bacterium]
MFNNSHIIFEPIIATNILWVFFALFLIVIVWSIWKKVRATLLRFIIFTLLLLSLSNPLLISEQRDYFNDTVLVVIDHSLSQNLDNRSEQTQKALASLQEKLSVFNNLDIKIVDIPQFNDGSKGTKLFDVIANNLAQIPKNRMAGIILITDGQVHDIPDKIDNIALNVPMHILLTGHKDERDRRLSIISYPTFGLVGKTVNITLKVEDLLSNAKQSNNIQNELVNISVIKENITLPLISVKIGEEVQISLPIEHTGDNFFELSIPTIPNELTPLNNRHALVIKGVRDRLKVLLVSGEPYQGGRTWRNLLKADPSVDLVHFTILRPPEKQDNTPLNELSLIAFPVQELFETKLQEFDLIIFDRYRRQGLLPQAYFDNIVHFVREGGALLEISGPLNEEISGFDQSPLSEILPAIPTGSMLEMPYKPKVTDLGLRHPVTAKLTNSNKIQPDWGQWFYQMDTNNVKGQIVMTGINNKPLLILNRVDKGRVAQLLSDQIWLWSRGFEGGGPQAELLKRIAHWLMKEPELEEDTLNARIIDNKLEINRHSLENQQNVKVEVTFPNNITQEIILEKQNNGNMQSVIPIDLMGVYKITDKEKTVFLSTLSPNALEFYDPRSTDLLFQPLVNQNKSGLLVLEDTPNFEIRRVNKGFSTSGKGWLGLIKNQDYQIIGYNQRYFLHPLLLLLIILSLIFVTWFRESR